MVTGEGSRVRLRHVAEWVWHDRGGAAETVRLLLSPAAALFRCGAAVHHAAASRRATAGVLPAIAVGNLTVGGTGKTPVASWFAARLRERGASPAIVLRGYGDDEWRVHEFLTPGLPVVINPDRVAGMDAARAAGADCAVLDDAFQHRRATRVADVVLISADRFDPRVRLLPAGPYREPMSALRRATSVMITVKAASAEAIGRVEEAVRTECPTLPVAIVRLVPGPLYRVLPVSENSVAETATLTGVVQHAVVLVSAIADPTAFEKQVAAAGVAPVRHLRYPDHHAFSASDVRDIQTAAHGGAVVMCTLKDAVKLAPLWPRAHAPLWYVSQTLVVDRGAEVLERECDRVLAARTATVPTVG